MATYWLNLLKRELTLTHILWWPLTWLEKKGVTNNEFWGWLCKRINKQLHLLSAVWRGSKFAATIPTPLVSRLEVLDRLSWRRKTGLCLILLIYLPYLRADLLTLFRVNKQNKQKLNYVIKTGALHGPLLLCLAQHLGFYGNLLRKKQQWKNYAEMVVNFRLQSLTSFSGTVWSISH